MRSGKEGNAYEERELLHVMAELPKSPIIIIGTHRSLAEETSFSTLRASWLSTLSTAVLTIFGTWTKIRNPDEGEICVM